MYDNESGTAAVRPWSSMYHMPVVYTSASSAAAAALAIAIAIAGRLTATVQSRDIVARVGGDEFVIVATELASVATAADLGQRLLAAFQAPFRQGELDCRVGVTIGYVLVPQDGTQIADLLKAADAAMYAGKQRGKGVAVRGAL